MSISDKLLADIRMRDDEDNIWGAFEDRRNALLALVDRDRRISELEAEVKQQTLIADRLRESWREDVETERRNVAWEAERATKALDDLGALKIEVSALREDRDRLDWLEYHTARTDSPNIESIKPRWNQPTGYFTTWEVNLSLGRTFSAKTLRAAIDAARAKERGGELSGVLPDLVEALQAVFDFYMGVGASGDFTCSCCEVKFCGICAMRGDTAKALASARAILASEKEPVEDRSGGSTSGAWRVGSKVPLNVYCGDESICQCHSAERAADIVAGMNGAAHLRKLLEAMPSCRATETARLLDLYNLATYAMTLRSYAQAARDAQAELSK